MDFTIEKSKSSSNILTADIAPAVDEIKLEQSRSRSDTDPSINANSVVVKMSPNPDDIAPILENVKEEAEPKKEKKKMGKPKEEVTFRTHLTTLAHVSVVVFVYAVLKLAFRGEFNFFSWHPILMSIGWMLMTLGFYSLSKYSAYLRFKTKNRTKIHVIVMAAGFALSILGLTVVYVAKEYLEKPHLASWHGIFGCIGVVSTAWPVFNGTLLWYKKELAKYIFDAKLLKYGHVFTGSVAFSFGALALILGVYSSWFEEKLNGSNFGFYLSLFCVGFPVFWAVSGPSLKLFGALTRKKALKKR